jgi:tetratricopeptide (TPR) repeat protein
VACAGYLGQTIWPVNLAVPYPVPESLPAWKAVAAVLLLAGILAAAVLLRRRCPYLLVGWLWYLGMLVPVLGLVRVGVQLTADRFTYLPQIGIYIAVVWAIAEIAGPRPAARLIAALAAAGFLAALAVCAWRQTAHWSDSETLWDHTLACTTRNYVAHSNLGVVFAGRGQVDQAIAQYEQALKIKSNYAHAHNNLGLALAGRHQVGKAIDHYHEALAANWDFAEAHNNLGLALAGLGQTDEAITHYREALRINPDYPDVHSNLGLALAGLGQVDQAVAHYRKALEIEPGFVEAHCNLGVALARRGQLDQAVAHWQRALDIKPRCVEAHRNLGDALAGRGHLDQAIAHWQKALEIKPDFTEVHNNLGSVLVGRGQTDSAIAHFEKVLEINPNDAIACNNLACIRATHPDPRFRDGTQAVNLARRAVAATRNDAWALDTLAAAYAEVGRFAEAIETAEQALKVAGNQGKTALADALRARIKLYRAGSPYRVTPPPAQSQRGK